MPTNQTGKELQGVHFGIWPQKPLFFSLGEDGKIAETNGKQCGGFLGLGASAAVQLSGLGWVLRLASLDPVFEKGGGGSWPAG